MYYQESDILLRMNPEYETSITELDKLLDSLGHNGDKQLNIEVVSDITGIKLEVIKYIFNYYCQMGILDIKKYITCPNGLDLLSEVDDDFIKRLPLKEFCDNCETEHVFTEDDLSIRYSINSTKNGILKGKNIHSNQPQSLDGENPLRKEYPDTNIVFENVHISVQTKEIVKIATVQLDYVLSNTFPPLVVDKDSIKDKILSVLDEAVKNGVDIICFPELCLCEEWLKDIELIHPKIAIIAGTYYDQANHNTCKILIDPDISVPNQEKIMPSEGIELPKITGLGMMSGDTIHIYETQFGKISVLICRDFGNFIERLADKIDIVFVPSYNGAPERFEEIANSHVSNHPSYIIISNSAIFGGTSIFGQMDKVYFPQLVQAGFKDKDCDNYKLCEIKKGKEGIIVANFNIMYKQIQKPTPINPDEAKRSVEYIKILDIKVNKKAD